MKKQFIYAVIITLSFDEMVQTLNYGSLKRHNVHDC